MVVVVGLVSGLVGSVWDAPLYQQYVLKNNEQPAPAGQRIILDEESAIISAVEKNNPAVVSIVISKDLPKLEQFGFFYVPSGPLEKQQIGAGSGFVVTEGGMFVTNRHAVSSPDAS